MWLFTPALRLATELELVRPDDGAANARRGTLWPWALGAFSWTSPAGWEIGAAVEASAGPEYRESMHALARVSYAFAQGTR